MSLTLRRTKGSQLTWDEVDANWTAGRTFDGTVLLGGEATAFDDLLMPLQSGKQGVLDKPEFDATNGVYLFPQADATEIIYFNVQLPHRWKVGSIVYPHVHWHQTADQTPVFKVDYRWTTIGGTVAAVWQTYVMDSIVVAPYTTGTIHQISKGAAGIDGAGQGISSILQCKLYRDDNVYTGDVGATSFDVHIEIDSFGSDTEYTK